MDSALSTNGKGVLARADQAELLLSTRLFIGTAEWNLRGVAPAFSRSSSLDAVLSESSNEGVHAARRS